MRKYFKLVYFELMIICIIFFLPLTFMLASLLFPQFKYLGHENLVGLTVSVERPKFSVGAWLHGTFQTGYNSWFNQNYAFRSYLVKLNNQIYYSVFRKSYMSSDVILICKDEQIMTKDYVYEYAFIYDPMPITNVEKLTTQISEARGLLQERGKPFLVFLTPSKAYTYPEYISDCFMKFRKVHNLRHNYEMLVDALNEHQIEYVDGQKITLEARTTAEYPLFCRGGIHWNYYGAFFTVEKLIEKMESLLHKKLGRIIMQDIYADHSPEGSDRDLATLLNLLVTPDDYLAPHATFRSVDGRNDFKPDIVVVGGSFAEIPLAMLHYKGHIVNSADLYAYYKVDRFHYPSNDEITRSFDPSKIDWQKDFLDKDLIVLEINEANCQGNHIGAFLSDLIGYLRETALDRP